MLIRRARLCGLLFCLLGCSQIACSPRRQAKDANRAQVAGEMAKKAAEYKCEPAKDEDRPRGGTFVLAGEGPMWGIYGTVLAKYEKAGEWEPVGDVVVELYSYSGGANQEEISRAVGEQQRVEACLTGRDGKFSLLGLKPGRYLLRAGSRVSDKYDEVYAVLTIDPERRPSGLKVLLRAGT